MPAGLILASSLVSADRSITQNVRRSSYITSPSVMEGATLSSRLMDNAVPMKEYQGNLGSAANNNYIPNFMTNRQLEENNNDDDYYSVNTMHDFSSYSLKYTKCQKVERFSSAAMENGESSPLVISDIVILRMCPQRRCKDDAELGCSVGYGEYVLGLDEYLKIMMQYETDKERNLCGLCKACASGYGEYYYSGYKNGQRERRLENGGNYDDDAAAAAAAAIDDDYVEGGVCATNSEICYNYGAWCVFDDDGKEEGGNENGYASYNDYLDYLGCVEVQDDMYVNARCDAETGQISMGVFYDPYCSQYAGDKVNVNNIVDEKFQADAFDALYSGECIPCESSTSAPYYNSNNNMCNKLYQKSAKCNSYIAYDFGNYNEGADEGSGTTCAFVEAIRDSVYDKAGNFNVNSSEGWGTMTPKHVALLSVLIILCSCLALYSCYIHHEMTNLLLKSFAQKNLMDELARKAAHDRDSKTINSRGGKRRSTFGRWGRKNKKVAPTEDDGVEADRSWE